MIKVKDQAHQYVFHPPHKENTFYNNYMFSSNGWSTKIPSMTIAYSINVGNHLTNIIGSNDTLARFGSTNREEPHIDEWLHKLSCLGANFKKPIK